MWFFLLQAQNIVLNLVEQTHQFCHFVSVVPHRRVAVRKGQILMVPNQQQTDIFFDDPIELVTRFVVTHDWLLQSRGENTLLVEVPGKWCAYQLAVVWRHDESAMQVSCRIDVQTDPVAMGKWHFWQAC